MERTRTDVDALLAKADSPQARMEFAKRWLDANLRKEPELARRMIDHLLPEAVETGDVSGHGWLLFQSAWLHLDADDFEQGCELLESAKFLFEAADDRAGVGRCLNALGRAHDKQGIFDVAIDFYRESISLAEEIERPDIASAASMNMAQCLSELGEAEEALAIVQHCERHYTVAPHNRAVAYYQKGSALRALGNQDEAERALMEGLPLAANSHRDALDIRHLLAETCLDQGRLEVGRRLVVKGLKDSVASKDRNVLIKFKLAHARLLLLEGSPLLALSALREVEASAEEIGVRNLKAEAERLVYKAFQAAGRYEEALTALESYMETKEAIRNEQVARRILGMHSERTRSEARHFESLYRQISAISEVGRRIASNLNLEDSFETIRSALGGLMDAPTVIIAVVDETRRLLDYRFVVSGERRESFVWPLEKKSFASWCVENRRDIVIGDLESEYRRYIPSYEDVTFGDSPENSLVFVPLFLEDRVVGVLSVQSPHPHAYDQQKVKILQAIGGYIAISIENSRLFRQIEHLASTDLLTDLPNRRNLMEELEKAHRKAVRYGRFSGVVMIDVDRFKRINDLYGHDVGDIVLRSLADALASDVRETDTVGRFGGEEFVVLLPETDLHGALLLAERLRKTVEQLGIALPLGETLSLTASFGVALISPKDPDCHAVLKRADIALYHAKADGRNCVRSFSEEES